MQTHGSVAPADGTDPVLVDRPMGTSERCVYSVGFLANEDDGITLAIDRSTNYDATMSAAAPTASANYRFQGTDFKPSVTVYTPGDATHGGKAFTVQFTRRAGPTRGCSAGVAQITYTIPASGGTQANGTAPHLIDQPAGQTERCAYDITFSLNETTGTTLVSTLLDTIATADDARASATYIASVTEPTGCPGIPAVRNIRVDDPTALVRHYRWDHPAHWGGRGCPSGTRAYWPFVYRRYTTGLGAALADPTRTSYRGSVRHDYSFARRRSGDDAERLLVAPILGDNNELSWHRFGVVARIYPHDGSATISSAPTPEVYSPIVCPLSAPNSGALTSLGIDEQRAYGFNKQNSWLNQLRLDCGYATSFVPDINIEARDGAAHAGKQFTVTFSRGVGPTSGCSPATSATYQVQADGTVASTASAPVALIDQPIVRVGHCVYNVRFSLNELNGTTLRNSLLDTVTSAADVDAGATYVVAPIEPPGCTRPENASRLVAEGRTDARSHVRRYWWDPRHPGAVADVQETAATRYGSGQTTLPI